MGSHLDEFNLKLKIFLQSRSSEKARRSLFQTIWVEYQKPLLYFIQSMVHEDAEDVFQEVMVKVYQNIHQYNPVYKFSSWIYAVARNHCINHIKRKKIATAHLDAHVHALSDGSTPELNLLEMEQRQYLHQAIKSLQPDNQQIAFLKYFENLSCRQIGRIMNMATGTVKSRLFTIRNQLKEALEAYNENR